MRLSSSKAISEGLAIQQLLNNFTVRVFNIHYSQTFGFLHLTVMSGYKESLESIPAVGPLSRHHQLAHSSVAHCEVEI